jgi:hypothetical protein
VTVEPFDVEALTGHLLLMSREVWACFVLRSVSRRGVAEQDAGRDHDERTARLHELVGYRVHERVSSKAFSASMWRRSLEVGHPAPLSNVSGAMTLSSELDTWEKHITDKNLGEHVSFLAVRVSDKPIPASKAALLLSDGKCPEIVEEIRRKIHHVDEVMARPMMNGARMTPWGVAYLLHTSAGLGLPAPAPDALRGAFNAPVVTAETLSSIWGATHVTYPSSKENAPPFSTVLEVSAARERSDHTRYVSILTAGDMSSRDATASSLWPWMADVVTHNGAQVHLEWSATFDIVPGEQVAGRYRWRRRVAEDTLKAYKTLGERAPERLGRILSEAVRVESEVSDGRPIDAARAVGVWRLAVVADTEDAVRDQRAAVIQHYASTTKHGIPLHVLHGQDQQIREFVTGAKRVIAGFDRRMPLSYLATSLSNLDVSAGTRSGPFRGITIPSRRPYLDDPFWGPAHRRSGLRIDVGEMGTGKSSEMGGSFIWAVRLGARAVLLDPTESFAKLATIPELAPHLQVVDVMKGPAGEFGPYLWVPDPVREEYASDALFEVEVANAEAERRARAVDTFSDLLRSVRGGDESLAKDLSRISRAVSGASARRDTNPWEIIDYLAALGEEGAEVTDDLVAVARTPIGMRVFPAERGDFTPRDVDKKGTIFVAPDLKVSTLPDPKMWTRAELQSALVLRNVGARALWEMYRDFKPKMVGMDEFAVAAGGQSSIRPMILRGSTDSRRRMTLFEIAGQNPSHLTSIDPRLPNLTGSARVFRLALDAARDALPYLRLPEGRGHEQEITKLPDGCAMVRDWDVGGDTTVQFDQGPIASHREALVTSPYKPPTMDDLDEYNLAVTA